MNMNKEKVRYMILKETGEGGLLFLTNKDKFDESLFGFPWDDFVDQVGFLFRESYITEPFYADDTICIYNSNLREKGEAFLENNKWQSKVYRTVKEIKDWIK